MRLGRTLAALTAFSSLFAFPTSAHATVFTGTCAVLVEVTFTPGANLSPEPTTFGFDGGGQCVTNADTGSLPWTLIEKSINFGGTASGLVGSCEAMTGVGVFDAGFTPAPAPVSAIGTLAFAGNAAGATLILQGSPMFSGTATLALDPFLTMPGRALACNDAIATSSATASLIYAGMLTFAEVPTSNRLPDSSL